MATLCLILTDATRLPSALTGLALRVEQFTLIKMSSSRWKVDIPSITPEQLKELLVILPEHGTDFHSIDE